ncbi:MAG: AAA family ATPase, partial [Acidimicrobiales bacterium]|nr:AAA family ATPase [Acidimicrobiales bacterium]
MQGQPDSLTLHEQGVHDRARELLADMRAKTSAAVAAAGAANEVDAAIAEWTLRRRLASLVDDPNGVFFGSIDDGRDELYVGRRHIEDERSEPVVIDWRAPAATPFYRATMRDSLELRYRKRHTVEDHRVVAVFTEDFDSDVAEGGGGVPDPLLAELERSRTGEMRDIVATIQAEQDVVIRAPLEKTLIVQGGPGTGKTAVGLHRAAFLLYEHREQLDHEGVLVVGPNQRFLRYISNVLPSLGEHAVTQLTVEGVANPRVFAKGADSEEVAIVKGDVEMADVLLRLARDRISTASIEVPLGHRILRIDADDVAGLIDAVLQPGGALNSAREGFQQRAATMALAARHERHPDERLQMDDLRRRLRGSREWADAISKIWPSQSGVNLLRQLYSSPRLRDRVMKQTALADSRDLLARAKAKKVGDERWTSADLILLDELEWLLNGTAPMSFGHVIVDEAQDLSAMALRMIRRRAKRASMTVLGDLAQATTPASQNSWEQAAEHLGISDDEGHPHAPEMVELTVGYRLPATLLDYASRLLPTAAP